MLGDRKCGSRGRLSYPTSAQSEMDLLALACHINELLNELIWQFRRGDLYKIIVFVQASMKCAFKTHREKRDTFKPFYTE